MFFTSIIDDDNNNGIYYLNIYLYLFQAGTVNRGSSSISAGLIVNDWQAFCGYGTTGTEMNVLESIFKLSDKPSNAATTALRDALIDR